jgi:hypothetical protein
LKQEQHDALKGIAREEGRSISAVVREIVRRYLAEQTEDARLQREWQALEDLARIRKQIREEHRIYQGDLLEEIRAERERDFDRVWDGAA